jgi:hypothetical protein
MPPGPIRIAAGDATGNPAAPHSKTPDYGPDSQGNIWWRDQAVERGYGVRNDYWYPSSNWPLLPDIYLNETQYYSLGDTIYRFVVPNGKYRIDYYVAQGGCSSSRINPLSYLEHLESQGQLVVKNLRPLPDTPANCYTPFQYAIPAQVTDNHLYFALRRVTDHTLNAPYQTPVTILSSFSVTAVSDQPHLTIDPAAPAPVNISQSLQLSSIGWYMSNLVRWALVSGPGSLSPTGLYTAPPNPTTGSAVVQATSLSDASIIASVTIPLASGTSGASPSQSTVPPKQPTTIRINCGDNPGFTDAQGRVWAADSGFIGPSIAYHLNVPIANASPDLQPLYQSARYTGYDMHNFQYQFALPNGSYQVTLKFADYSGSNRIGYWNFDIKANGSMVKQGFDPVALVGSSTAIDVTTVVTVTGGSLTLEFNGGQHYAIVNGIEILPM